MKLKKYLIAIFLILSSVNFLGCDYNQKLSVGFNITLPKEEDPGIYVAYEIEYREVNINDFKLVVYYGRVNSAGYVQFPEADFYLKIYNPNGKEKIERKIENFDSQEYWCKVRKKKYSRKASIEFFHHEELSVPADYFLGDVGKIVILVKGSFDSDSTASGSNAFYYKKKDNSTIVISNKLM